MIKMKLQLEGLYFPHLERKLSSFHHQTLKLFSTMLLLAVFRIRSDPYHLAGSGSTTGNEDPDPGTKTKV